MSCLDPNNEFKDVHEPELQEPNISAFFSNDCFINLRQVGSYLKGHADYPGMHISSIPKNLKAILD
jgi:hypothetical protein